jgi:hypothetical protein
VILQFLPPEIVARDGLEVLLKMDSSKFALLDAVPLKLFSIEHTMALVDAGAPREVVTFCLLESLEFFVFRKKEGSVSF